MEHQQGPNRDRVNRDDGAVGRVRERERVAFWIEVVVAVARGVTAAAEYYAAHLLELSLSVDNIFVFVVIISELHIPAEHQRRVLLFGVARVLAFTGAKMIGSERVHISPGVSVGIIGLVLGVTITVSIWVRRI